MAEFSYEYFMRGEQWGAKPQGVSAERVPYGYVPFGDFWPETPFQERLAIIESVRRDGFNEGIEAAALHLERAGVTLMAREIRDLKEPE